MTEAQIAELERIAVAAGHRVDTAPFLRILEERRRLLAGIRALLAPTPGGPEELNLALEAIAFAEEESK